MITAAQLVRRFNKGITHILPSYHIRISPTIKMLIGRKLPGLQALIFARLFQDRSNLYTIRSAKIGVEWSGGHAERVEIVDYH
jgi:hypothetical protein